MTRLMNDRRVEKVGQATDNVSDDSLIKKIFTIANENVSSVLDTK